MKLACYFICHQTRSSRDRTPALVTLARVRELRPLRVSELAYTVPSDKVILNDKNWPKTLEGIVLLVARHLGVKKIPLQYVIWSKQNPRREINDPMFGSAGSEYISHQEEMTARAPFFSTGTTVSANFTADNNSVWDILQKICKEHTCWTVLRPWQKTKDGRNTYLALYNHYLGPSKVDNMARGRGRKT